MYTKCRVLSLINQLESLFWLIMFYFMLKWTKIVVMCKHPDPGTRTQATEDSNQKIYSYTAAVACSKP